MYGYKSGIRLGNTEPGDGYKYRGRGFNGLTGRANYKKYGSLVGENLEGNPDSLDDPRVAAKVAIAFMLKGKSPNSLPKFDNEKDASNYFADLNAGGSSGMARSKASETLSKFEKIA
jgi:putative chitinase